MARRPNQFDRQWTGADTRRLKKLHADGLGCNAIAREMGWSVGTIHSEAKRLGLSFDRSQVEAANVARSVDAKALRQIEAARIHALLGDVLTHGESARDGRFKTLIRGQYGADEQTVLDFIPTDHGRQLAASITQLVNAAAKIEAIDSDSGVAEAVSLLGRMAAALGLVDDVDTGEDDDVA